LQAYEFPKTLRIELSGMHKPAEKLGYGSAGMKWRTLPDFLKSSGKMPLLRAQHTHLIGQAGM
jgi:hypothetical protein